VLINANGGNLCSQIAKTFFHFLDQDMPKEFHGMQVPSEQDDVDAFVGTLQTLLPKTSPLNLPEPSQITEAQEESERGSLAPKEQSITLSIKGVEKMARALEKYTSLIAEVHDAGHLSATETNRYICELTSKVSVHLVVDMQTYHL
jgi:hypothetical protein